MGENDNLRLFHTGEHACGYWPERVARDLVFDPHDGRLAAFYPQALQDILGLLPFAAMHNLPLRLYSGHIAGMKALEGIALQVVWLVILLLFGRWWMDRQLKRVIVQGG